MYFTLSIPGYGLIRFKSKVPDDLQNYRIPGATIYAATSERARILLQEIESNNYTIWITVIQCLRDTQFRISIPGPLTKVKISLMNSFEWKWNRLKAMGIRENHFNMVFLPDYSSVLNCYRGQTYMFMDITYSLESLQTLASYFPLLKTFLDIVSANQACALLQKPIAISNEMEAIIGRITRYSLGETHLSIIAEDLCRSFLLHLLLQSFYNKGDDSEPLPKNLVKINQARMLVEQQVKMRPLANEIAASVGMTIAELKKGFKTVFKLPINKYWNQFRLRKSCEMLSGTDRSIKEIAQVLGFKTSTRFIVAFKKAFGTTPSKFRLK